MTAQSRWKYEQPARQQRTHSLAKRYTARSAIRVSGRNIHLAACMRRHKNGPSSHTNHCFHYLCRRRARKSFYTRAISLFESHPWGPYIYLLPIYMYHMYIYTRTRYRAWAESCTSVYRDIFLQQSRGDYLSIARLINGFSPRCVIYRGRMICNGATPRQIDGIIRVQKCYALRCSPVCVSFFGCGFQRAGIETLLVRVIAHSDE